VKHNEIEAIIDNAIKELVVKDSQILLNDGSENNIEGNLYKYLSQPFNEHGLDVDNQYSTMIENNQCVTKKINILRDNLTEDQIPKNTANIEDYILKKVTPDIIVHKRNTNLNLLVLELKKSTNKNKAAKNYDKIKLVEYTRGYLHYEYGALIEIKCGKDFDKNDPYTIEWYIEGGKI